MSQRIEDYAVIGDLHRQWLTLPIRAVDTEVDGDGTAHGDPIHACLARRLEQMDESGGVRMKVGREHRAPVRARHSAMASAHARAQLTSPMKLSHTNMKSRTPRA